MGEENTAPRRSANKPRGTRAVDGSLEVSAVPITRQKEKRERENRQVKKSKSVEPAFVGNLAALGRGQFCWNRGSMPVNSTIDCLIPFIDLLSHDVMGCDGWHSVTP